MDWATSFSHCKTSNKHSPADLLLLSLLVCVHLIGDGLVFFCNPKIMMLMMTNKHKLLKAWIIPCPRQHILLGQISERVYTSNWLFLWVVLQCAFGMSANNKSCTIHIVLVDFLAN